MSRKWIVTVVTLTANAISADPIMKKIPFLWNVICYSLKNIFFLSFHRKKLITKIESGSIIFLSLVLISFLICFYCNFDEQKDLSLGLSAKSWVLNFTRMPIAQYCALIHYNHGAQPVILHLSLRWWGDLYFLKIWRSAFGSGQSAKFFDFFFRFLKRLCSVQICLYWLLCDIILLICIYVYVFKCILQIFCNQNLKLLLYYP